MCVYNGNWDASCCVCIIMCVSVILFCLYCRGSWSSSRLRARSMCVCVCVCTCIFVYVHNIYVGINMHMCEFVYNQYECVSEYMGGVATISRLLKMIGLLWKRAL